MSGPLDVLDHPQGFLDAFAYTPLPSLLDALGDGWATKTLSIKRYPGCAYVDTTIDALLELGPLCPDEIASVEVNAGMLSCEMDALSCRYGSEGPPTPVTVNFSVAWNVAITLLAGRLTPAETNEAWLAAHHVELASLAHRVALHHDWELTLRTVDAMAPLLAAQATGSRGPSSSATRSSRPGVRRHGGRIGRK